MEGFDNVCPECKKGRIVRDYERAETYCEECGAVYDSNLPGVGSGRNDFDEEGRPQSPGGPAPKYKLHDKGLSTDISYSGKDAQGRSIDKGMVRRLRRVHWQTITGGDRSFIAALQTLDNYGSRLGLPEDYREEAAYYLKETRHRLSRGRSFEDLTAAIYYLVCIGRGTPRSLDFVCRKCNRNRKFIGRAEKALKKEVEEFKALQVPDSESYLPWLCTDLKLSVGSRNAAKKALKEMKDLGISTGRNPVAVAATATYVGAISSRERRTQREVCNAADITEVTLRNIIREYEEKKGVKVNSE
ncbi:MAG: TFIIB-type zinc ribbon-containing protein [Candidatus Aenigmatarchaeota archaeon]